MIVAKRPQIFDAFQFLSSLTPNTLKYSKPCKEKFHGFNVFVDENGPFVVVRCDGRWCQKAYDTDYLMRDQDDNWSVISEKKFKRDYSAE